MAVSRPSQRTRYVAAVACTVAALYTVFVVANTPVVGPTTPLPVPGLSRLVYLQDALDLAAAYVLIATGAAVLDRLLARDQALQTATLGGLARVTALAKRIADTGEFRARVTDTAGATGAGGDPQHAPPAVVELAATFNAMLARLEASFEAQRRLVADTSHELRNPLTVLRTNLAVLQRDDVDDQVRLEAAREADEEAARLSRLVDDLLLLSRGETGEALIRRPVRLDRLVAETAGEAREAGAGHVIAVSGADGAVGALGAAPGVPGAGGLPPVVEVLGDAERLRQVLRNVVGNALRHTPPGTHVHVALVVADGSAEIAVADDGPGIAAEHLPRLFDRFYRVDSSRSRGTAAIGSGSSGAGLGLAIVRHLVEAHDGSVTVESTPGAGTTVRLRLPLARPAGGR